MKNAWHIWNQIKILNRNHVYSFSIACLSFIVFGCEADSNSPSTSVDCRQSTRPCAIGFACQEGPNETYRCLPESDSEPDSLLDLDQESPVNSTDQGEPYTNIDQMILMDQTIEVDQLLSLIHI